MNGLKFIRIRCNLSLNELAGIIGVTRQALSSWENDKKVIPKLRLEQLSDYFGIEEKYFGDISENDKEALIKRAMYRYDVNGKEAYRYKKDNDSKFSGQYYWGKLENSLDEELVLAKKRKQDTLQKISDIIDWSNSSYRIDQIMLRNRNCGIYEMINELMELLRHTEKTYKVPFFYELTNIWKAMMLAYGLISEDDLSFEEHKEHLIENGKWIVKLAEILKQHWEEEKSFQLRRSEERKQLNN